MASGTRGARGRASQTPGQQQPSAPAPTLTQEQLNAARFALEQRKAEADIVAIEAKTARENEESRVRIAAMKAGAATAAAATTNIGAGEVDISGEISQEAQLVASRYSFLPKAETVKIFNKFQPQNLYKLRRLHGREDKDRVHRSPARAHFKKMSNPYRVSVPYRSYREIHNAKSLLRKSPQP
ncbi:hypothetical protein MMC22_012019 [Lobaria immixta]|nr:hypothetical protein [Lobaria immixta]